jgi:5-methylcytosine-specific restriction endonuclease McrA
MPKGSKGKRRKHYDKIGQRYHRLVVIADAGSAVGPNGEILGTNWLCQCDCGNQHTVLNKLLGKVKSCGCLNQEKQHEKGQRLGYLAKEKAARLPAEIYVKRRKFALYSRRKKGRDGRNKIGFYLTYEQAAPLFFAPCFYCGSKITWAKDRTTLVGLHGIDRLDSSKPYTLDNVVPCCKHCNYAKNDMSVDQFKEWIFKVHSHLNT